MSSTDTKRILDLIETRRARHRERGYSDSHDDSHENGELGKAALNYLAVTLMVQSFGHDEPPEDTGPFYGLAGESKCPSFAWPFEPDHWHPADVREMLIETIGFLVAEVERIDRKTVRERVLQ